MILLQGSFYPISYSSYCLDDFTGNGRITSVKMDVFSTRGGIFKSFIANFHNMVYIIFVFLCYVTKVQYN